MVRSHTTWRARLRAFTLIELLVVIAVIALLVGILLPALGKARQAARCVKCLANIRSLELAQQVYADTFKGFLVDYGLSHGGASSNEGIAWVNTLEDYYGASLVLHSPGDKSPYWPSPQGQGLTINGQARRTSYGMNNLLGGTEDLSDILPGWPFNRLQKIDNPSRTCQFLCMTQAGQFAVTDHTHIENWGSGSTAAGRASNQIDIALWGGSPTSLDAKSNYAFLDGHAATTSFSHVYTDWSSNSFNPTAAR